MADLIPIPMGIPWDPWDPSLSHSHAHLYSQYAPNTFVGWGFAPYPTGELTALPRPHTFIWGPSCEGRGGEFVLYPSKKKK